MWWLEFIEMFLVALFALLVMGIAGIIFMELVDLLAKFILWLGPDPFGFIGGLL